MKKQKIQLFILALILILVLAVFLILRYRPEKDGAEQEDTSYSVLSLSKEELKSFTIISAGETFAFIKGESGWESDERTAGMLDQDTLESMLAQVMSLRADGRIENVSDLSGFGLAQPEVAVILVMADGTEYRLAFGDYNEMTGVYYMGLNSSDVVYTTPLNIKGSFQVTWEKLSLA